MLGYDLKQSSDVLYTQYKEKLKVLDPKYHDEVHFGYFLVSDPQFSKTIEANTKEGWKYLDKSMKIPPTILINNYIHNAKHIELKSPMYQEQKPGKLHCYLCEDALATNILQKTKFMKIKCNCNSMIVHINCANKFIMKYSSCDLCKKYYDITPHCSSLRDIL